MKKIIPIYQNQTNTGSTILFVEENSTEINVKISFFNKDNDLVTDKSVSCDKSETINENKEFFDFIASYIESDDIDADTEIYLIGLKAYAQTYFCYSPDQEDF